MGKLNDFFVDKLEIPYELLHDDIKFTVYGTKRIVIERHKGIAVYREQEVRIGCNKGLLIISGTDFTIKNYGKDDIVLEGEIKAISFEIA